MLVLYGRDYPNFYLRELGNTGVGKGTFVNYMLRHEMFRDAESAAVDTYGPATFTIGYEMRPEILYAKPFLSEKYPLVFKDFPRFQDNRLSSDAVVTSISTELAVRNAHQEIKEQSKQLKNAIKTYQESKNRSEAPKTLKSDLENHLSGSEDSTNSIKTSEEIPTQNNQLKNMSLCENGSLYQNQTRCSTENSITLKFNMSSSSFYPFKSLFCLHCGAGSRHNIPSPLGLYEKGLVEAVDRVGFRFAEVALASGVVWLSDVIAVVDTYIAYNS
ncbi:uncharacterized protein TRIADDRAFT_57169 [Trichoplax adhaerens]|uniref:Uncharacterized protein n=1 Tax=Trichoplax adhaerens TaxID=10228 RepID=B3S0U1_TRIAD|nr:predicted protein [Trichoplax adhaerens]EDV23705.1 predicted protein [Trichoplax adhaerens]|eukprot:XP_002113231.1 predicted protein [Trichoplax adhaerens]